MPEKNKYFQEEEDELKIEETLSEPENEDEAVVEYDIASYPSDFTLDNLYSQWEKKSIVIPKFQREYVWNIRQASLLIDSFMMGLPVPPVFLYLSEDNKYIVIDGQQRLLSIFFFFGGVFGNSGVDAKRKKFRLTGLDESIGYAGKTYEGFSAEQKRKFDSCVLRAINIRQISPSEQNTSVYHIFERLNTGGTALKPQEIRNCVFAGDFMDMLKSLNKDDNWRKIIGKSSLDKYQKDVELLLRIFALIEKSPNGYENPMKEFLNKAMQRHKNLDSDCVKKFNTKFPETCKRIVELLGEKPFHVRGPINSAYLDSVFCTIYSQLESLPNDLRKNYELLKEDEMFNGDYTLTGTQDTSKLKARFKKVKLILFNSTEQ